jgi:hypothetical protein
LPKVAVMVLPAIIFTAPHVVSVYINVWTA